MSYIVPIGKNTINLIFATDDNYIPYFSVALQSILASSNPQYTYDVIVLDDNVSTNKKETISKQIENHSNFSIRWFNMRNLIATIPQEQLMCHRTLTQATYFRLWIPELFQKYQKVLYLDCDIVLLDDVAKLFQQNIGKKWIASSLSTLQYTCHSPKAMQSADYTYNILKMKDIHNYLFADVLLYNIPQMRKNKIQEKSFLLWEKLKNPINHDQDILSILCEGHVYWLDWTWNFPYDLVTPLYYKWHFRHMPKQIFEYFESIIPKLKLIHFYSLRRPQDYPLRKLSWYFWYYARFSPYYKEIIDFAILNKCGKEDQNFLPSPKISVIIPIYNRENCILKTLQSVLSQTLKEIEIICIDDGSTDSTYEKIYDYAAQKPQIRLLHFSNQGAAISRNIGITEARGEFIAFMDSDDYYPKTTTLETMYLAAKQSGSLICGGRLLLSLNSHEILYDNASENIFTDRTAFHTEYDSAYGFYRFIYNRLFIKNHQIAFPALWRYEDPPFMLKAFCEAKSFFALSEPTYVYVQGIHPVDFSNVHALDVLDGMIDVLKYSKENNITLHRKLYKSLLTYTLDLRRIAFAQPIKKFYLKIKTLMTTLDKDSFTGLEYPKTPLEFIEKLLNCSARENLIQKYPRRHTATFIIKKKVNLSLSYLKKFSKKCDKEIPLVRLIDQREKISQLPQIFKKSRKLFPYSCIEYKTNSHKMEDSFLKSAKKYEITIKAKK